MGVCLPSLAGNAGARRLATKSAACCSMTGARLSRSKFRSRFRLGMKERQYCLEKGAPVIEQHAAD
ncbi:DUF4186 family protein, partial [Escherichia sp. SP-MK2]